MILVRKPVQSEKQGGKPKTLWRFCLDLRLLNRCIVQDAYCLPDIRTLHDSIGTLAPPVYLTKMDMDRAFWQIKLHPDSKQYTAFTTPLGNYVCNCLPMGLATSPSVYSRPMAMVLHGLPVLEVLCYLVDLLIVSDTFNRHKETIEEVLKRLKGAG